MSVAFITCPECSARIRTYRNPVPTVDVIIEMPDGIVLIERKNEPYGWALPGGFVDYGESLETAARREALEETGIVAGDLELLGCYSDPDRDPRQHNITTVFITAGEGTPVAADDAATLAIFPLDALPQQLCFDHRQILDDYLRKKSV
jgi:8-oxo-dGTP diphosphatase